MEHNSVNRAVVSGYFDKLLRPSTDGKDTGRSLIALTVPQIWKDEVSGELMRSHYWIDLLFLSMPEPLRKNFESHEFKGGVFHGRLSYRETGKYRHRQKALLVVEDFQLLR